MKEWSIVGCDEDLTSSSTCICGKEGLRYRFEIRNIQNSKCLYPIGSTFIEKFERKDLDTETRLHVSKFKLLNAFRNNERIELDTKYFTRMLLRHLYEDGCFPASKFNGGDDKNGYLFLLDMFNKKNSPSEKQRRRVDAIIINSIKPYLEKTLSENRESCLL